MPEQSFQFNGSSALSRATYDPATQDLSLTFTSGRSYTYRTVPMQVYEQLVGSDSPGRFWRHNIKDAYS